jgi:hypothetical protein
MEIEYYNADIYTDYGGRLISSDHSNKHRKSLNEENKINWLGGRGEKQKKFFYLDRNRNVFLDISFVAVDVCERVIKLKQKPWIIALKQIDRKKI